jgi:hypothetical protein
MQKVHPDLFANYNSENNWKEVVSKDPVEQVEHAKHHRK